jgi:8-oxo-dGTP pyrophosphatase MutT (NUDIX family)
MSSEQPSQSRRGSGRGGTKRGGGGSGRGGRGGLETSAGGVVIGGEPGRELVATIVPVRRSPDGARVLCLPKGHIDPGENALQAAVREVREEAGVVAERIADLGEIRYHYRREGRTVSKSVLFFLFAYVSGDTCDHDDEVETADWMDLRAALTELSYEGERTTIARALSLLEGGSPPRRAGELPSPPASAGDATLREPPQDR